MKTFIRSVGSRTYGGSPGAAGPQATGGSFAPTPPPNPEACRESSCPMEERAASGHSVASGLPNSQ